MPNYYTLDNKGIDYIVRDVRGPVAKELIKRGQRVKIAAQAQAGVDTGRLKSSISANLTRDARGLKMTVGSNVRHALVHHEGSKPHLITARRRGGMLRFPGRGGVNFARVVRHPGTRPNRYLSDNLRLAVR